MAHFYYEPLEWILDACGPLTAVMSSYAVDFVTVVTLAGISSIASVVYCYKRRRVRPVVRMATMEDHYSRTGYIQKSPPDLKREISSHHSVTRKGQSFENAFGDLPSPPKAKKKISKRSANREDAPKPRPLPQINCGNIPPPQGNNGRKFGDASLSAKTDLRSVKLIQTLEPGGRMKAADTPSNKQNEHQSPEALGAPKAPVVVERSSRLIGRGKGESGYAEPAPKRKTVKSPVDQTAVTQDVPVSPKAPGKSSKERTTHKTSGSPTGKTQNEDAPLAAAPVADESSGKPKPLITSKTAPNVALGGGGTGGGRVGHSTYVGK